MKRIYIIIVGGLVIVGGIAVSLFSSSQEEILEQKLQQETSGTTEVIIVGNSTQNQDQVTVFGQIVSVTEVEVYPEIQGVVASVRKPLGGRVGVGDAVVVLDDRVQREQLISAQAGLSSAQADYQSLVDGATALEISNLELAIASAKTNYNQAQETVNDYVDTVYSLVAQSLDNDLDPTFFHNNALPQDIDLKILADPISDKYPLNQKRIAIEQMIQAEGNQDDAKEILSTYEDLAQNIITHINNLSDSQMDTQFQEQYRQTLRSIITTVNGWQTTLSSYQSAVENSAIAVETSENALQIVLDGADTETLAAVQGRVDQARSVVESAQLALGKTVISAPVLGDISQMNARVGQLVSPGTSLFTVSNDRTLRVDSSVSPQIARMLSVGSRVVIDGMYDGFVSVVAPSVDPKTGQVDIEILLNDSVTNVQSGTGVQIQIATQSVGDNIVVPISAVFVRQKQPYVYVVRNGIAEPQPITVEDLFGEQVVVTHGLANGDVVVRHARETEDGASVVTK